MKAIVYHRANEFSLEDTAIPECGDDQALIRVKSCGICKTDVHIHQGHFTSRFPLVPGHEFSGIVEKTGKRAGNLAAGDRVVADNASLCGDCYYCRRDKPLYCENFHSLGVNGPGGFADFVVVDANKVFRIPDDLDFDRASFTEPVACAVHGMDRIGAQCGDQALIFGAGPAGIILAQLLQLGGASDVLLAAPTLFKLKAAEELGIRETLQISRGDHAANEKLIRERYPKGFDIVIDATGAGAVAGQCFRFAKKGAKIIFYGVYNESETIAMNPYRIFADELTVIGSCAQTHCFPRALQYLTKNTVRVDTLISRHYRLEEYATALDTVISGKESLKVIINPGSCRYSK
ncbi:MAG: zinc-dependent alcohol dehydrogenase family protein [Treponema sp.]|jgi:D-arabinitol dehydrogenase (NADP+)|nr:zinc-dependent alcohol dehydrogenase family protein [Treponema sp.]